MAFKRKNPFGARHRGFRKRPRFRRRAFRRRRTGYASSSRWGRPYDVGFRKRRMRPRTWRRLIFRDTEAKQHYRSAGSGNKPTVAPALGTPQVGAFWLIPALQTGVIFAPFHAAGQLFWQTGGGAQDPDFGQAVPPFIGDIVLRGGIARLTVHNTENVVMRVKVYAIWAHERPSNLLYTTLNNTNGPVEYDPSISPDFATTFGKILYKKEVIVPTQESYEIVHRFKPQKIDQERFAGEAGVPAGSQLWWGVTVIPLDTNGIAATVQIVNSWNLSFTGDTGV